MKSLYNVYEVSILADIDDQIEAYDNSIRDRIEKWIKENYDCAGLKISDKPNEDGLYEVDAQTVLVKSKNINSLTNGLFVWNKVRDFNCNDCDSLKSLEGSPKKVRGTFSCSFCNNLKSLEGAPEKAYEMLVVSCTGLKSLKGTPNKLAKFNCKNCTSLESLEGAPDKVSQIFICDGCKSLKSLKGAPTKLYGVFSCDDCTSLKSLEGAPNAIGTNFICKDCKSLTSLKGAPKKVGGIFDCTFCSNLQSLEGIPKTCEYFRCFGSKTKFNTKDIRKISNAKYIFC